VLNLVEIGLTAGKGDGLPLQESLDAFPHNRMIVDDKHFRVISLHPRAAHEPVASCLSPVGQQYPADPRSSKRALAFREVQASFYSAFPTV